MLADGGGDLLTPRPQVAARIVQRTRRFATVTTAQNAFIFNFRINYFDFTRFIAVSTIRFRCSRCMHAVKTAAKNAGMKLYCPVCYLELTVPAETVPESAPSSDLYTTAEPLSDTREILAAQNLASFRCTTCHTNIAVGREQVGTEIVCPECDTKLFVPETILEKLDRSLAERVDRLTADLIPLPNKELYSVLPEGSEAKIDPTRIPVRCKLCNTLMYADQDELGTEIACPDCGTTTIVALAPPPMQPNTPEISQKEYEQVATFALAGEANPNSNDEDMADSSVHRLRVWCKLCNTLMYATEDQVGTELTCPDCDTKTTVELPKKPEPVYTAPATVYEESTVFQVAGHDQPKDRYLIPVVCFTCGTRMYAGESAVGEIKICPDCGTENLVKAVPKDQMSLAVEEIEGSYGVAESDAQAQRPVYRPLVDYRDVNNSTSQTEYRMRDADDVDRPFQDKDEPRETDPDKAREKRRKLLEGSEKVQVVHVTKPPLPKRPFVEKIFASITNPWLLLRMICTGMLWSLALTCAVAGTGFAQVLGIIIGLFFWIIGGIIFADTCQAIFVWSNAGNNRPESDDWPDVSLSGPVLMAVWFLTLIVVAGLPGYLLAMIVYESGSNTVGTGWSLETVVSSITLRDSLGTYRFTHILFWFLDQISGREICFFTGILIEFLLMTCSALFLFPIFFLSCMEANNSLALLSKSTLNSLLKLTGRWLQFYAVIFICFISVLGLHVLINSILSRLNLTAFCGLLNLVLILIGSFIYFRLLGRLAWVLEEEMQEMEQEEEEQEDNEE